MYIHTCIHKWFVFVCKCADELLSLFWLSWREELCTCSVFADTGISHSSQAPSAPSSLTSASSIFTLSVRTGDTLRHPPKVRKKAVSISAWVARVRIAKCQCGVWLPKILPLPLEKKNDFRNLFRCFVCPVGVVVRFRAVVAENITLRPYGQQLLKLFWSWDREKAWNRSCRSMLGGEIRSRQIAPDSQGPTSSASSAILE